MKKNLLTIWAKRAVPALALAGVAGLTLPSCEKENDKPIYRAPYEKELFFDEYNMDSISFDNVRKYAKDTACKHIYLTVAEDNDFTPYGTNNILGLRNMLQECINFSNNISGRGDFHFRPNTASVNDSLWFVQNGWTIRQKQY